MKIMLSYGVNCVTIPQIHMLKYQTQETQNVTVFGDKVFKEVINMRSFGWALIHVDWCPCTRRR